ncbi:MAG: hypothetical protein Q9225_003215 [Loekoesia sp. 1 TL-2023]
MLKLCPGGLDKEITLSLASVFLDIDKPLKYHALSYTWGNPTKTKVVIVQTSDGPRVLPVTDNLYTALQHLRNGDQARYLWVDAICINQENITERNAQVANMADIYRSAALVVIWLGPGDDHSKIAMETISNISSRIKVEWTTHNIELAHPKDPDSDLLSFEKELKLDQDVWDSLDHLLNREWFYRLWIWQEVFLAEDRAQLMCGFSSMTWDSFRKAILLLVEKRQPSSLPGFLTAVTRAWRIASLRDRLSIAEVLEITTNARCSDQRDRVYGVLELIWKAARPNLQPDYTKSTAEVFQDLMLVMLLTHRDLSLLRYCKSLNKHTDMPSWVPDFSKPLGAPEVLLPRTCWNSYGHARRVNEGPLTVCGCRTATVTQTVGIFNDGDSFPPSYLRIFAALRSLLYLLREKLLADFDSRVELICRTLCRNNFGDCYEPISDNLVNSEQTAKFFMTCLTFSGEVSDEFLAPFTPYLDVFYASVSNSQLVFTAEGFLGLAPKMSRPDDVVVAILGCQTSMILNPLENGQFNIVGECYVHEVMTGNLFLGPLAEDWQRVWRYDEETQGYWDAFVDRRKGKWQFEDPRLGPLPDGWFTEEHSMQHVYHVFRTVSEDSSTENDPRMTPEALSARGVDIQEFNLV